ncbi:alpha/beta fold hydrolase [Glaciecola petra]|uniref:Alpha/beta fold hydrolase n=1 Tax=Glaciecola petra TaxID=3075602 RepID=A0ABU2ZQR7_9ALTE|nr:alpha/beta fold hydrolase [Aestuariibacter sp. P117]MDT0594383.1 alpha/beta fold hydrolase [Aestuariibacter sp. P117]
MSQILHYKSYGAIDKPCVVLIHGLFGSSDNLSVIRRALENDYFVINIDLPDHGESPWSDAFSFKRSAQQLASTLQHIGISSASFVAHSLGGKVAMTLCHMQAQLINHLIILDMAPVAYEPRHHNVISGLTNVDLATVQSRKDAQLQLSEHVKDVGTAAFLLKSLYNDDGIWKWRFNLKMLVRDYPILSKWDLTDELVFTGKVLFIKGQHSDYITSQHQAIIKQQFPNATAKIINAGHWLHAEKRTIVNTLITKYLNGY